MQCRLTIMIFKLKVNLTDGFFKTLLNVNKFQSHYIGQSLKMTYIEAVVWNIMIQRGDFGIKPVYYNGYHQFLLALGSLQPPLLTPGGAEVINYASLGSLIGTTMMQVIDDKG